MNTRDYGKTILQELQYTLSSIDPEKADILIGKIMGAGKVYVAGAGRSLLVMRAFAMRLMHMGLNAYVVGETSTPAAEMGDLLIIGSGSGETDSLVSMAKKARKLGIGLAIITIFVDSTIGKMADNALVIPASTTKVTKDSGYKSVQPGGTLFEQSLWLMCDTMVLRLAELMKVDANQCLDQRHANIE